ncbi:MAG TPA: hypothetical protein VLY24_12615 [Bryobacteraceae bacterium]|nr:hypothetical protein [Bryobacteraceae bacterium]
MAVVDPDPYGLAAELAGEHKVEILVAIDIAGADVEAPGGTGLQVEAAVWLAGKENLDAVPVGAIDQALRPGDGKIGAVVAVEIA